jgi:hypothetical protein
VQNVTSSARQSRHRNPGSSAPKLRSSLRSLSTQRTPLWPDLARNGPFRIFGGVGCGLFSLIRLVAYLDDNVLHGSAGRGLGKCAPDSPYIREGLAHTVAAMKERSAFCSCGAAPHRRVSDRSRRRGISLPRRRNRRSREHTFRGCPGRNVGSIRSRVHKAGGSWRRYGHRALPGPDRAAHCREAKQATGQLPEAASRREPSRARGWRSAAPVDSFILSEWI